MKIIGVDVGTARIVAAKQTDNGTQCTSELNAFVQIPAQEAALSELRKLGAPLFSTPDGVAIYGERCVTFAELFNIELRRPMRKGCIDAVEPISTTAIRHFLESVLGTTTGDPDQAICFSVPSPSIDNQGPGEFPIGVHTANLFEIFSGMGYQAIPVKEAEALVYAELQDEHYSGIGISFGAGLCNVSLSYLAIPVVDFSIGKGGDFIDEAAGKILGLTASNVRLEKEATFTLEESHGDHFTRTLQVLYSDLISGVIRGLQQAFSTTKDLSRIRQPFTVILAGGTSLPAGFAALFESALRKCSLPIQIKSVRMARDPLTAVAQGCLQYGTLNQSRFRSN